MFLLLLLQPARRLSRLGIRVELIVCGFWTWKDWCQPRARRNWIHEVLHSKTRPSMRAIWLRDQRYFSGSCEVPTLMEGLVDQFPFLGRSGIPCIRRWMESLVRIGEPRHVQVCHDNVVCIMIVFPAHCILICPFKWIGLDHDMKICGCTVGWFHRHGLHGRAHHVHHRRMIAFAIATFT